MKRFLLFIAISLPGFLAAQTPAQTSSDSIKTEFNKNSLLHKPQPSGERTLYGSRQVRAFEPVAGKKVIYKTANEQLLELKTLFDAGSITSRQYESLKIKISGSR